MTGSSPCEHPDIHLPRLVMARRFAGDHDGDWHVHDAHEIVLLTHGRCDITCGEVRLTGRLGSLFLLPQGLPQYQSTHGFTRTSYICFTAPPALFAPTPGVISTVPGEPAGRWFEDICTMDPEGLASDTQPITQGLLTALLAWVRGARLEQGTRAPMHPALARAVQLVTDDLVSTLDLARLARQVGLSTVHLSRLFRIHFGCGPVRWQQRLRLMLAERMLTTSPKPVAEIARACGYADANYFSRLFRARYRAIPSAWRGHVRNPPLLPDTGATEGWTRRR